MRHAAHRWFFAIALAASGTTPALAQPAPPIKPGLWQLHIEHEGEGASKMPDMAEQMKNMPPEQRKQVEAMMKSRGVDMTGSPGNMKICLSSESLSQGHWQGKHSERCKTDVTNRAANGWKWHSVCTEPASESDGEAIFSNAENYTVKTSTTTTTRGEAHTTKSTLTSKWLGADCGDIKPMHAPTQK